jgi:hypothetical protein
MLGEQNYLGVQGLDVYFSLHNLAVIALLFSRNSKQQFISSEPVITFTILPLAYFQV